MTAHAIASTRARGTNYQVNHSSKPSITGTTLIRGEGATEEAHASLTHRTELKVHNLFHQSLPRQPMETLRLELEQN